MFKRELLDVWVKFEWKSEREIFTVNLYGSGWGTPDPYFDTLVSSFVKTLELKNGRLCFGYDRLFRRLRNQQMDKAAGYCRQMLKLKHDTFLMDLLVKIQPGQ